MTDSKSGSGYIFLQSIGDEPKKSGVLVRNVLVAGEETNGVFSIVEQILPKGKISDRHMHTQEGHSVDVIYGEVLISIEDEIQKLSEGDFIYIPPNVWHEFKIFEDTRIRVITFPAGLEHYFKEIESQPVEEHDKITEKYGMKVSSDKKFE